MTPVDRLQYAVSTLPEVLRRLTEAEAEHRPAPERWTKKEVLGHLIDSASNNHQRLVRAQIIPKLDFPGYEQEAWVRAQQYQKARWTDLIDLWRAFNLHLLHVVSVMPGEGRRATCRMGGGDQQTLAALFEDYVDHLEHHLRKILGDWPFPGEGKGETLVRSVLARSPDRAREGTVGRPCPNARVLAEKINLRDKFALFTDHWNPKIVGELNGQKVKLVKLQGEFVFHHHDNEDELFLVIKGRLRMEFRDRHVWLEEGEFLVVPRGMEHRPVADDEAHVLLFEPASTRNTGNVLPHPNPPPLTPAPLPSVGEGLG